jgi:hypothetical protein
LIPLSLQDYFYRKGTIRVHAERLSVNPVITPGMSDTTGDNINGPSLIKAPPWVDKPLGKYYLYFAHHKGESIRLAYADNPEGPWKIHESGALQLNQTICSSHIASPDVHIDEKKKMVKMYFHGPVKGFKRQVSLLATSLDGISFTPNADVLGDSYFRVFEWNTRTYALSRMGKLYYSDDHERFEYSHNPFERFIFKSRVRHVAVKIHNNSLLVFHSRIGDCPERILMSEIDLLKDHRKWSASRPVTVLRPEHDYEGANLPVTASKNGIAELPEHALRDPAIFTDDDRILLLYSVAGEQGIAIATLSFQEM